MIWQTLNPNVRSQDIKLQKGHTLTIKAMIAVAHSAEDLKAAEESLFGCKSQCFCQGDGLSYSHEDLCQGNQIKPALSAECTHLCSHSSCISTQLFGEDLPQQVRELSEINQVGAQLRLHKGSGTGPGTVIVPVSAP